MTLPKTAAGAGGYPLLLVLHGNNSTLLETVPRWSSAADAGWAVAVPQSSEIGASPGAFTWNDDQRTLAELMEHLTGLKRREPVDLERVVLAGFSMGGLHALALPLRGQIPVRAVIAVAAWLPHIREFEKLLGDGAKRDLRAYLVVGTLDPSSEGARQLVEVLNEREIPARLDVREGLGHDYPADMEATLRRALAFVSP